MPTPPDDTPFDDLIADTVHSAVHLEMRDHYTPGSPRFRAWRQGHREDPANRAEWWNEHHTTIAGAVARGVTVRRVRVVSEPLSDYVRFEYDVTFSNLAAGEQVRWLPRHRAIDLALPALDFWLFDDRLARFHHFDGSGEVVADELLDAPHVIKLCAEAFEAVWDRAINHEDYRPV